MEQVPGRKAFENLEDKHQREKEEFVGEAHVDALIEDILRTTSDQEFKNLEFFAEAGIETFKGTLGGHDFYLYRDRHAGTSFYIRIGNIDADYKSELSRYSNQVEGDGNPDIKDLFEKIYKIHNLA